MKERSVGHRRGGAKPTECGGVTHGTAAKERASGQAVGSQLLAARHIVTISGPALPTRYGSLPARHQTAAGTGRLARSPIQLTGYSTTERDISDYAAYLRPGGEEAILKATVVFST